MRRPATPPPYDHSGETFKINLYLGYAALLVAAGIWIWPDDPWWWGFYFVSVVLCLAAFGLMVDALRTMRKLHKNRQRWNAIHSLGNAPKNAALASSDDLRKKGMIN